ncbi:TPA: hypothetical protein ACXI6Y_005253 [Pseudomonas aeruginosa]
MALPLAALTSGVVTRIAGSSAFRYLAAKTTFSLGEDVFSRALLPNSKNLSLSGGSDFAPHMGTLTRADNTPGLVSSIDLGRIWGKADILRDLAHQAQQQLGDWVLDGMEKIPGVGHSVKTCRLLTEAAELFGRDKNIPDLMGKLRSLDLGSLDLPVPGTAGKLLTDIKDRLLDLIDETVRLTGAATDVRPTLPGYEPGTQP